MKNEDKIIGLGLIGAAGLLLLGSRGGAGTTAPGTLKAVWKWQDEIAKSKGSSHPAVYLAWMDYASGGDPGYQSKDRYGNERLGLFGVWHQEAIEDASTVFQGTPEDLLDARTNIRVGVWLVDLLLTRTRNDILSAAAYYFLDGSIQTNTSHPFIGRLGAYLSAHYK